MSTLILAIFIFSVGTLFILASNISRSYINPFSIFAGPYLVLVPLNQLIAAPFYGMYSISNQVILMILGGIVAFFLGGFPFLRSIPIENSMISAKDRLSNYFMIPMETTVLVIGFILVVRVFLSVAAGSFDVSYFDESTEAFSDGIFGHLRLVGYVLLPIVSLWAIETKRPKAILGIALIVIATFATFKKNYLYCMLVTLIIFIGIYDKRHAKKMAIGALLLVPLLFFANYFLGFMFRDAASNVPSDFYITRFFVYSTGSLVYDNYIFEAGIRVGISVVEKLATFLFAFPNLFIGKIFGVRLFPHERQAFYPLTQNGQTGNVVDFIGYMFPSGGDALDIASFLLFFAIVGFMSVVLTNKALRKGGSRLNVMVAIFLSEFVFFSFFGTFYVNSTPWESLLLAALVPWLFLKRTWAGIVSVQGKKIDKDGKNG